MTEVSVVICAYSFERWDELKDAVASVLAQTKPAREIFLVVDGNEELRDRAACEIEGVRVLANAKTAGLSGARMTGVEQATSPVIVFLDDDAIADACWLEELLEAYSDPCVLGAGGKIDPLWRKMAPSWFPAEFNWVVGCTYEGMQVNNGQIRNVIGANMSIRKDVLDITGGFTSKLGRRRQDGSVNGLAGSCEETELCIRAAHLCPGGIWAYRPKARVRHVVSEQRTTWRYFVHRCRMEGNAKGMLADLVNKDDFGSERRYALNILSRAVLREIGSSFAGKPGAAGRAAAMCAGLAITTAAYARTRLQCRMASNKSAHTQAAPGTISTRV